MAYIFRFSPLTQKVKELLSNDTIGKPFLLEESFRNTYLIGIPMRTIGLSTWPRKSRVEDQY